MKTYYNYTSYTDQEDKKRLDFIVSMVRQKIPADGRILDVGCGNGNISKALGSCGYRVTGIDISTESIENARRTNPFPNVEFMVGNAEDLPVEDEFDAVVCSEVLEHLHNPEELVRSLEGLVKKDRLLIVTVPNGFGPRELLVTKPVIAIEKNGGGEFIAGVKKWLGYQNYTVQSSNADLSHVQFFTRSSLTSLLHKFNFRNIAFRNANFVEKVFPVSILAKRLPLLQKLDCRIADYLPSFMSSGFYTAWVKK